MTTGQRIFVRNARQTLCEMGMTHLDPAHGAAVEAVRWCLAVRSRPTHHRQSFLERDSPALLAYLEALANSDGSAAWRTLEERIRLHAELLREREVQECTRPWLAAIWHGLPEFAGIGQYILSRQTEKNGPARDVIPSVSETTSGAGGEGDKGSAGKAGSTGTTAKPHPRPSPRLVLPAVAVALTEQERKALDLGNQETEDGVPKSAPEGADGPEGTRGTTDLGRKP